MKPKKIITHNADGTLTQKGALIAARAKLGEMATISSDPEFPRVWVIGAFRETLGRGKTWEQALERSKPCPKPVGE